MAALPSLRTLQAFEAVARLGAVGAAATELGISQPAVSQHLRRLEAELGLPLVKRTGTGIALTEAGRAYAADLAEGFARLRTATAALRARRHAARSLTVSALATFAQRWLIPRLARFQAARPDLEVRLATVSAVADLVRDDTDVAIIPSNTWPGCALTPLMPAAAFPVAAPALLAARPLATPADLARHTWIRVDAEARSGDWPAWLRAAGVADLQPAAWFTVSHSTQAIEAALAGLGIALAHSAFVADVLATGALAQPLAPSLADPPWHLATPHPRADHPPVRAFRAWLLAEAG